MKVKPDCPPCLLETAVKQVKLATDSEELRIKALSEFLKFLSHNFSKEAVPAGLGSERAKIVRRVTSCRDPYKELKEISNKSAFEIKPFAEKLVKSGVSHDERIKTALKISAAANSMEFGVSSHEFDPEEFRNEFEKLIDENLEIDDSSEIVSRLDSSDEVIFLTDNCGEIVLDQILMNEIKDQGIDLLIGVKSEPVQEDVDLNVAKSLNLEKFGRVFPTGDKVGLWLGVLSEEIRKKMDEADLVLAKGMGNFETISEFDEEFENRLVHILRAKCQPVSDSFGVERGDLVIKLQ